MIREFAGKVPVLGVCLGHQCIYDVYGGTVAGAGEIKHGKTSTISHDGKGVFAGHPERLQRRPLPLARRDAGNVSRETSK